MVRINLLGRKKKIRLKPIHLELGIFSVVLIVLLVGIYMVDTNLKSRLKILNDEIAILDSRLSKLKKIKAEIDGFEKKRDLIQKKIDVVIDLKKSQKGYYKVLTNLEKSMPDDVWVRSFSFNGGGLGLSCSALKFVSVNEFIVNMFESEMFYNIDINQAKKNDVDAVEVNDFTVNSSVKMGQ